ncbi:MAG: GIY-YIG nuclease family protein [Patescibacteria group bacterium]|jgi:putative endonuclease
MYYVYILQNAKTKRLYAGYTSNLRARLDQHNQKNTPSTKSDAQWILVYYEAYRDKKDATIREWNLKHQGRQRDFLKNNLHSSLL